MPRTATAVVRPADALPNEPPPCAQAEALREQTEVGRELVEELRLWRETFKPAAETIVGFGARLDALCRWLRKWGPWVLASAPTILLAIGAISPNAAAALKSVIAGLPS